MEDILDVIVSRRSVKQYKDEYPSIEDVEKIIKAGTYAPSGRNKQSSIIIAISNKDIINKISGLIADFRGVSSDPFYGAPIVLAVLSDKDVNTHVYDGSVVIENMLLEAHSLGLGACWIHHAKEVFETDYAKDLLNKLGINGEYEGVGFCIVGIPEIVPEKTLLRKANYVYYLK